MSRWSRACRRLRVFCDDNEWGIVADLTFTGVVEALEEPHTFSRRYERVIQDVSRYAQVGVWEGSLTAAGRTFEVTPDTWKGVRDRSWGVRPVGEREAPGIRARESQDGYGFRHDWLPMQFDDHMLKVQIDQDSEGHRHLEESMRVWNLGDDRPIEHLGPPEVDIDYQSGTREIRQATVRTTDPDGAPIVVTTTPLRTLYLAAGSGYVPDEEWGHGYYQGPLEVEGVVHDLSDAATRRRYAFLNETLCRFETDTGQVGFGMHENMLIGVYRPERLPHARRGRALNANERYEPVAVTGRVVGHSMSGSGSLIREYFGTACRPVVVGGVHPVLVVLGDDLVAEDLEHLEDLVVVEVLRQAEHELVAADRRVGGELLGHLVGGADHHVAALDQLVEERLRVARHRCRAGGSAGSAT